MIFYIVTTIVYPLVDQVWLVAGFDDAFINRFVWSLVTITLESFIIILLFIHWSMKTYEIRPAELVFKSGFLKRRADIHSLKNMQTVYMTQSLLGRIFNYGNVRLFNPMSKEELLLEQITDPNLYAESLRQVLEEPSKDVLLRSAVK